MADSTYLPAHTMRGAKVVNSSGEHLGKIEDLMIDMESTRVAYVVLSFGGYLMGIGDKLFAIPMEAFKFSQDGHDCTLNVDKTVLEKAEGFDKDKSSLTHEELDRVYTHYGYKPHLKR
jgi:sporulation protein YlmC with PRC-barrel domain